MQEGRVYNGVQLFRLQSQLPPDEVGEVGRALVVVFQVWIDEVQGLGHRHQQGADIGKGLFVHVVTFHSFRKALIFGSILYASRLPV